MRRAIRVLGLILLACGTPPARADEPGFPGEWRTSLGVMTFETDGDALTATFTNPRTPAVKGSLKGKTATLSSGGAKRGDGRGDARRLGPVVPGVVSVRRRPAPRGRGTAGAPTPRRPRGQTGRFAGLWLTTSGLMELEQDGDKVKGQYARVRTRQARGDDQPAVGSITAISGCATARAGST